MIQLFIAQNKVHSFPQEKRETHFQEHPSSLMFSSSAMDLHTSLRPSSMASLSCFLVSTISFHTSITFLFWRAFSSCFRRGISGFSLSVLIQRDKKLSTSAFVSVSILNRKSSKLLLSGRAGWISGGLHCAILLPSMAHLQRK